MTDEKDATENIIGSPDMPLLLPILDDHERLEGLLLTTSMSQVTDILTSIRGKSTCPSCGTEPDWMVDPDFSVDGHVPRLASLSTSADGRISLTGGYYFPVYRFTCATCSHLMLHGAYILLARGILLGLVGKEQNNE